ncbi:MAG: hypothetical protein KJ638_12400 [Chloroflexi bacterium]|nr:hypothetical protein [Chloroflexota bacterium]
MRIEAYFREIPRTLEIYPGIRLSNVTYDKRGAHADFIRGELVFVDDSVLHIREFVDVESTVERLMYAYQYMDADRQLIFRYDNSGHHRNLDLPTYPHHKHEGSQSNVIASSAPILAEVLAEIENLYIL